MPASSPLPRSAPRERILIPTFRMRTLALRGTRAAASQCGSGLCPGYLGGAKRRSGPGKEPLAQICRVAGQRMRPHPPDPHRVLSPPQVLAAGAGDTFRAVIPLCTLGAGRWGKAAGASERSPRPPAASSTPPSPAICCLQRLRHQGWGAWGAKKFRRGLKGGSPCPGH